MNLTLTRTFVRDYQKLPQDIQELTDKQLGLLLSNPNHPSLNLKKMQDPRDIWEGRITLPYRLTFQVIGETYVLRKVGTDDVLRNP